MKKILLALGFGLLLQPAVFAQAQTAAIIPTAATPTPQRHVPRCGLPQAHLAVIAKYPSFADVLNKRKAALQSFADYYIQYREAVRRGERTESTISAVPVIFHIIVDSVQFNNLGGTNGIIQRCDSQIVVLNRDYNQLNLDAGMIPSAWRDSLYGNVGIHFGLARIDPVGNCSPGYEIKVIPNPTTSSDTGFDNEGSAFPEAKTAGTGLPAWDITKYYNVWCVNFTGAATGLLGLTVSLSDAPSYGGINNEGACILYNALGSVGPTDVPPPGTGSWYISPDNYAWGRTLTHETGHMFEIWHPWGDDNGRCPWNQTGTSCTPGAGYDDGLFDTPPESDAQYGNPTYGSVSTINDCCQMDGTENTQPIGIACISFMDYVDDNAMHLFTPQQAAAMAAMVLVPPTGGTGATGSGTIGENYNLTQNPGLLIPCPNGIAPSPTELHSSLSVYPNPTTGEVNISVNSAAETLDEIDVINLLGQRVIAINGQNKDYYTLDLSNMGKGIYFIKCNFASGSVVRKIVLQ